MQLRTGAVFVAACLLAPGTAAAQADEHVPHDGHAHEETRAPHSHEAHPPRDAAVAAATGNPDISLNLTFASSWFSEDDPVQLGAHDPTQTGFVLQQLELLAGANVDRYARMDASMVFSSEGVELEEAYLTTLALPGDLRVRAGQILFRIGRLNPTHPHAWAFADQPLVNGKFLGAEGSRGPALELGWVLPLPWRFELVSAVSEASSECCARSFQGEGGPAPDGPEDLLYTPRIEQFFTLGHDWSLLVGASGQFGPGGPGTRSRILAADLYLRWQPADSPGATAVSLQVEAMSRQREVGDDKLEDHGGHATLLWDINPNWQLGGRHEVVTGLSADPIDPDWTETRQRSTAQITWNATHFSRVRLQGSWSQPDDTKAVILAFAVLIGAHGGHPH